MSKYHSISEKRRIQLIDYVMNKKKTLSKASRKLKINISTAKNILDTYLKKGKILQKPGKYKEEPVKQQKMEPQVKIQDEISNPASKKTKWKKRAIKKNSKQIKRCSYRESKISKITINGK